MIYTENIISFFTFPSRCRIPENELKKLKQIRIQILVKNKQVEI